MTREEMIARAQAMRSRDIFGAVPQEIIDAVPAVQQEITVAGTHVYAITPKAGLTPGCPMVINYHGGGFIKGRQTKDHLFCNALAVELQCLVWDVDYKLAPEYPYPTAVQEAYAVAEYAFSHWEALGIDPKKIVLMGHSAGGNLAVVTCIKSGETGAFKPAALVAEFFPTDLATDPALKTRAEGDMPAEVARTYNAFYCDPETARTPYASPEFATEEQLAAFPDTLIMTAKRDSLSFEAEEFAKRLSQAGVTVTCRRFLNSRHGFTINRDGDWEASQALLKAFIKAHF